MSVTVTVVPETVEVTVETYLETTLVDVVQTVVVMDPVLTAFTLGVQGPEGIQGPPGADGPPGQDGSAPVHGPVVDGDLLAFYGTDGTVQGLSHIPESMVTNLTSDLSTLAGSVAAETARAMAAEAELQDAIDAVTGAVSSVFGRTGAVVAAPGDYSAGQIAGSVIGNYLRVGSGGYLEERTPAQARGDLGAAPTASPTFTGTAHFASVSVNAGLVTGALAVNGSAEFFADAIVDGTLYATGLNLVDPLAISMGGTGADLTLAASGSYVRKSAGGPLEARSPSQVLADVGGAAASDLTAEVSRAEAAEADLQAQIDGTVAGVSSVFGRSGAITAQSGDYSVAQITGAAPLASPTFTGTVTTADLAVNGAFSLGTPLGWQYGGTGVNFSLASSGNFVSIGTGHLTTRTPSQVLSDIGGASASGLASLQSQVDALVTGVSSVFGRAGDVTAQAGDYTVAQVYGTTAGSYVRVGSSSGRPLEERTPSQVLSDIGAAASTDLASYQLLSAKGANNGYAALDNVGNVLGNGLKRGTAGSLDLRSTNGAALLRSFGGDCTVQAGSGYVLALNSDGGNGSSVTLDNSAATVYGVGTVFLTAGFGGLAGDYLSVADGTGSELKSTSSLVLDAAGNLSLTTGTNLIGAAGTEVYLNVNNASYLDLTATRLTLQSGDGFSISDATGSCTIDAWSALGLHGAGIVLDAKTTGGIYCRATSGYDVVVYAGDADQFSLTVTNAGNAALTTVSGNITIDAGAGGVELDGGSIQLTSASGIGIAAGAGMYLSVGVGSNYHLGTPSGHDVSLLLGDADQFVISSFTDGHATLYASGNLTVYSDTGDLVLNSVTGSVNVSAVNTLNLAGPSIGVLGINVYHQPGTDNNLSWYMGDSYQGGITVIAESGGGDMYVSSSHVLHLRGNDGIAISADDNSDGTGDLTVTAHNIGITATGAIGITAGIGEAADFTLGASSSLNLAGTVQTIVDSVSGNVYVRTTYSGGADVNVSSTRSINVRPDTGGTGTGAFQLLSVSDVVEIGLYLSSSYNAGYGFPVVQLGGGGDAMLLGSNSGDLRVESVSGDVIVRNQDPGSGIELYPGTAVTVHGGLSVTGNLSVSGGTVTLTNGNNIQTDATGLYLEASDSFKFYSVATSSYVGTLDNAGNLTLEGWATLNGTPAVAESGAVTGEIAVFSATGTNPTLTSSPVSAWLGNGTASVDFGSGADVVTVTVTDASVGASSVMVGSLAPGAGRDADEAELEQFTVNFVPSVGVGFTAYVHNPSGGAEGLWTLSYSRIR